MSGQEKMTAAEFLASGLQMGTARKNTPSIDYKQMLLDQMKAEGLPDPVREFRFHATRRWRFDYLIGHVAIEFDGGIFSTPDSGEHGHTAISAIMRDQEKINEAQISGFMVIRVNAKTVADGTAIDQIKRAVRRDQSNAVIGLTVADKTDLMRVTNGLLKRIEQLITK